MGSPHSARRMLPCVSTSATAFQMVAAGIGWIAAAACFALWMLNTK